jgi:hypothetical protein
MASEFERTEKLPMSQAEAREYLDRLEDFEQDGPYFADKEKLELFLNDVAVHLDVVQKDGVVTVDAAKKALLDRLTKSDQ